MSSAKEYLQAHRAALFDWIVLLTSFLLGFAFPSLRDLVQSPLFYGWMLAALLLYIVGAALKHLPLSYRLTYSSTNIKPVPYLIFLLVGHWFIIFFLVILSEGTVRDLLRLPPLTVKNTGSWQLISSAMITATFVTWLVYRTKSKRKKKKKYGADFLFRMELVADLLLAAGVSIFSFVFWEKGAMGMLGQASTRTLGDVWFLFVFLAILFLFFNLPLRYLFFIEDRERGRNRRRLLLLFGFILVKAVLELVGI